MHVQALQSILSQMQRLESLDTSVEMLRSVPILCDLALTEVSFKIIHDVSYLKILTKIQETDDVFHWD